MRIFFILLVIFSNRVFAGSEVAAKADRREVVRKVMTRAGPGFKDCYDEALKTHPKLAGKVVLEIKVKQLGVVANVNTKSDTLQDKNMLSCLVGKVKALQFPPGHNVMFTYPLVFYPPKKL